MSLVNPIIFKAGHTNFWSFMGDNRMQDQRNILNTISERLFKKRDRFFQRNLFLTYWGNKIFFLANNKIYVRINIYNHQYNGGHYDKNAKEKKKQKKKRRRDRKLKRNMLLKEWSVLVGILRKKVKRAYHVNVNKAIIYRRSFLRSYLYKSVRNFYRKMVACNEYKRELRFLLLRRACALGHLRIAALSNWKITNVDIDEEEKQQITWSCNIVSPFYIVKKLRRRVATTREYKRRGAELNKMEIFFKKSSNNSFLISLLSLGCKHTIPMGKRNTFIYLSEFFFGINMSNKYKSLTTKWLTFYNFMKDQYHIFKRRDNLYSELRFTFYRNILKQYNINNLFYFSNNLMLSKRKKDFLVRQGELLSFNVPYNILVQKMYSYHFANISNLYSVNRNENPTDIDGDLLRLRAVRKLRKNFISFVEILKKKLVFNTEKIFIGGIYHASFVFKSKKSKRLFKIMQNYRVTNLIYKKILTKNNKFYSMFDALFNRKKRLKKGINKFLKETNNKKFNKKTNKKSNKKTNKKSNKKTNKKSNKKTNKKSNKKINKKSNKKINKKSNKVPNVITSIKYLNMGIGIKQFLAYKKALRNSPAYKEKKRRIKLKKKMDAILRRKKNKYLAKIKKKLRFFFKRDYKIIKVIAINKKIHIGKLNLKIKTVCLEVNNNNYLVFYKKTKKGSYRRFFLLFFYKTYNNRRLNTLLKTKKILDNYYILKPKENAVSYSLLKRKLKNDLIEKINNTRLFGHSMKNRGKKVLKFMKISRKYKGITNFLRFKHSRLHRKKKTIYTKYGIHNKKNVENFKTMYISMYKHYFYLLLKKLRFFLFFYNFLKKIKKSDSFFLNKVIFKLMRFFSKKFFFLSIKRLKKLTKLFKFFFRMFTPGIIYKSCSFLKPRMTIQNYNKLLVSYCRKTILKKKQKFNFIKKTHFTNFIYLDIFIHKFFRYLKAYKLSRQFNNFSLYSLNNYLNVYLCHNKLLSIYKKFFFKKDKKKIFILGLYKRLRSRMKRPNRKFKLHFSRYLYKRFYSTTLKKIKYRYIKQRGYYLFFKRVFILKDYNIYNNYIKKFIFSFESRLKKKIIYLLKKKGGLKKNDYLKFLLKDLRFKYYLPKNILNFKNIKKNKKKKKNKMGIKKEFSLEGIVNKKMKSNPIFFISNTKSNYNNMLKPTRRHYSTSLDCIWDKDEKEAFYFLIALARSKKYRKKHNESSTFNFNYTELNPEDDVESARKKIEFLFTRKKFFFYLLRIYKYSYSYIYYKRIIFLKKARLSLSHVSYIFFFKIGIIFESLLRFDFLNKKNKYFFSEAISIMEKT